jgi:hypothetical protein
VTPPRAWSAQAWPPRPLALRFAALGALYWIAARIGLAIALAMSGAGAATPSPVDLLPLAGGAALLALIEGRRRRHLHFLGNLGVRPHTVVALWTAPVVLLELCYLALA